MQTYDLSLSASRRIEDPQRFLAESAEAVLCFPDSLPLHAFRVAQRVRWGDLEYQDAWATLLRAGLEGGAPEAWVRRELFHGFANSAAFKEEPPRLTALESGAA